MEITEQRQRRIDWLERVCIELHDKYKDLNEGEPASYIPELACVEPDRFGVAGIAYDGQESMVGDSDYPFTIQSISKLMLFGLALETHGADTVLGRVGVAPTGEPFNSIDLDEDAQRAPNPMVNAGAIAVTDLVVGGSFEERLIKILDLFERYLGRRPDIDWSVHASERANGDRNRAIAYLLLSEGVIEDRVEETLSLYFAQCSILVTVRDLALIGATIGNGGIHPITGDRVHPASVSRDMLTIALTCGMYDYAGEWAFTVGIPAKSGVGGGILGVVPGAGGLATFSPRLDEYGNSIRGLRVFEALSLEFDLHLFDFDRPWTRTG